MKDDSKVHTQSLHTNRVEIIMADSSRDVEHQENLSKSDEIAADNVLEELADLANFKDAFADKSSLYNPLSHIHEEPNTLTNKFNSWN
nr:hypothetical protein [Tanacetum cinerariifolium]